MAARQRRVFSAPLLLGLLAGEGEDGVKTLLDVLVEANCSQSDLYNRFPGIMRRANDATIASLAREVATKDRNRRFIAAHLITRTSRTSAKSHGQALAQTFNQLLEERDYRTIGSMARIISVQGEEILPHVKVAAEDSDDQVRSTACRLLGEMQPLPETGAALLRKLLNDESTRVRGFAIRAVRDTCPGDPEIVASLIGALDEPELRKDAIWAIEMLGPRASRETETMSSYLECGDEEFEMRVAQVLWAVERSADRFVPFAIRHLQSDNRDVRRSAVALLRRIGTDAKPAVEQLEALLADGDATIREAAKLAIAEIERDYVATSFQELRVGGRFARVSWKMSTHEGRVGATASYRTHRCTALYVFQILDSERNLIASGQFDISSGGSSSKEFSVSESQEIKEEGKIVAIYFRIDGKRRMIPENDQDWKRLFPEVVDSFDRIGTLKPEQVTQVGDWKFIGLKL